MVWISPGKRHNRPRGSVLAFPPQTPLVSIVILVRPLFSYTRDDRLRPANQPSKQESFSFGLCNRFPSANFTSYRYSRCEVLAYFLSYPASRLDSCCSPPSLVLLGILLFSWTCLVDVSTGSSLSEGKSIVRCSDVVVVIVIVVVVSALVAVGSGIACAQQNPAIALLDSSYSGPLRTLRSFIGLHTLL